MVRLFRIVDSISIWSGKIVSVSILLCTAILVLEVVLRYVFNKPTIWAHETSLYIWGAYGVLAGAYALVRHVHIKVDIIYNAFPKRVRAWVDSFTFLMFFLFVGLMFFYGMKMAWKSISIGEYSITAFAPLVWPIKLTVPIGAFLILLQGIVEFIRTLHVALKGKELS